MYVVSHAVSGKHFGFDENTHAQSVGSLRYLPTLSSETMLV